MLSVTASGANWFAIGPANRGHGIDAGLLIAEVLDGLLKSLNRSFHDVILCVSVYACQAQNEWHVSIRGCGRQITPAIGQQTKGGNRPAIAAVFGVRQHPPNGARLVCQDSRREYIMDDFEMADLAHITPEVLTWARERVGLTYAQVAKHVGVTTQDVRDWETYQRVPHFSKAQRLAHFLRVPFGVLFLSNRPKDDSIPIPDFRTLDEEAPLHPSPELADVLNDVSLKQEWYREYAEQNNTRPLPFVRRFQLNGIAPVARDIRETLGMDRGLASTCSSWSAYMTRLSTKAQEIGVLVMRSGIVRADTRRPLSVDEFRGFALVDDLAPVVFINSRDSIAAQIFTLIHELAHIWIGQSALSNPDPTEFPSHKFEKFCNSVAAETLVPANDFEAAWEDAAVTTQVAVSRLARMFWVSTLVILRRAFELQKISKSEFFRLVKEEKDKQVARRKSKGGDQLTNIIARNSRLFTKNIVDALRQNRLLFTDAARLLGLSKFPALPKLAKKLSQQ